MPDMPFHEAVSRVSFSADLQHGEGLGPNFFRTVMSTWALQHHEVYHTHGIEGFLNVTTEELWAAIGTIIPHLQSIVQEHPLIRKSYTNMGTYSSSFNDEPEGDSIRVWDKGYIHYDTYSDGSICVRIGSIDLGAIEKVIEVLDPLIDGDTGSAKISVIVNGSHGPRLMNIGEGGTALIPDNYHPEAQDIFDHLVEDLAAPNPCGRLSILTGLPGTGKTYFLEGIIAAQPNCRYILLPPAVITAVAAPDLLTVLLPDEDDVTSRSKTSRKRIPTVLIVEDADQCLVSRQLDNLPAISAILNLADGIQGRALDIRLLTTSNAKKQDIDKALLRDGRLCRAYDFKHLPTAQAQRVYDRELGDVKPVNRREFTYGMTLAEVYRAAKDDKRGVAPCLDSDNDDAHSIGFGKDTK